MAFNLNRLKAERVARGYTQAQFANKLHMSREAYAKRESGKVNISVEEFANILRALGYDTRNMSIFFAHNVLKRERKYYLFEHS